jgi:hypothetical protein
VKNDFPVPLGKSFLGIIRQMHRSIVEDHMNLLTRVRGDDLLHQPEKIRSRVSLDKEAITLLVRMSIAAYRSVVPIRA